MIIQAGQNADRVSCAGKRRAFTLIEVLFAAAISAIILVAVFVSVSESFSIITVARQNLRATQIMVSRLEGLRLEAWGAGASGGNTNLITQLFNNNFVPTNFNESFYPLGLNGTTNQGVTYYGTMTVSQLTTSALQASVFGTTVPSYATNVALITITLSWTNSATGTVAKGTSHHRSMSTLVSAYGLQNYIYAKGTR